MKSIIKGSTKTFFKFFLRYPREYSFLSYPSERYINLYLLFSFLRTLEEQFRKKELDKINTRRYLTTAGEKVQYSIKNKSPIVVKLLNISKGLKISLFFLNKAIYKRKSETPPPAKEQRVKLNNVNTISLIPFVSLPLF